MYESKGELTVGTDNWGTTTARGRRGAQPLTNRGSDLSVDDEQKLS